MPSDQDLQLPAPIFAYKEVSHLAYVKAQTEHFHKKLVRLQEIDRNIALGLGVGTGCYVGSYLFPLVTCSITAYCFATWNLAQRRVIYQEYQHALNDLIAVYEWSMGKATKDHWYKLEKQELQDLILTLGPWVLSQTIHTWKPKDLIPSFQMARSSLGRRTELNGIEKQLAYFASGEQEKSLAFKLYGENSVVDILAIVKSGLKPSAEKTLSLLHQGYRQLGT